MASWSKQNRELQRFTSRNSRKKSKSAFIMTSKRPAHTLRSRRQITRHIKSSSKTPSVNETTRQQKNNAILAEQEAAKNRTQALQARYDELQKQEDDLLRQIGEAKQPGPAYYGGKNNRTLLHHPNPQKSQLPLLQSHLSDVRRERT